MRSCELYRMLTSDLAVYVVSRRRDSASQLVYRMCEEHAVHSLMTYTFAGLADEVEDALSFKARNADPRIRPFYSRILYTWYINRGDYRNGLSAPFSLATCHID